MQNQRQRPTTRERIKYLTWSLICTILLFMLGIIEIIYGNVTNGKWIPVGIFIVCVSVVGGGLNLWLLLRLRSRGRLR